MKPTVCFPNIPNSIGLICCSVLLCLLAAVGSRAATFTVTNTNDSGAGSLRQAIMDASASGALTDTINFNIPGTGVKKIMPLTNLPLIAGSTILDGTTQPGWAVGNLVIEISGENNTDSSPRGLFLISQNNPQPSVIRGLVINRFGETGIHIQDSENVTIEGCFIGTDVSGTIDYGNNRGVKLLDTGAGFDQINITVGGDTPAERNVISGNDFRGIDVDKGTDIFIKGNYIGTDASGRYSVANGTGMKILSSGATIGGATQAEGNVISGNSAGVNLDIRNHILQNNYIGVAADGISPLGNANGGLTLINSLDFVTRGGFQIINNIIANNGHNPKNAFEVPGIVLFPTYLDTHNNRISQNSIYNNESIGIDLDRDGITANDTGDADVGTNNLQNYPVLTSAVSNATTTTIQGTLNSAPSASYRIEFFSNPSDRRETRTYLGFQDVATNSNGNANINAAFAIVSHHGHYVTATATRVFTPFDTSEVSATIPVVVTSFVVTNTNNSGTGSLRQAILDANAATDSNLITFAIAPLDGSVKTINLTSALPTITNPLAIDGLTQNGAGCSAPKIELNGTSAGAGADGLTFTSDNNLAQGLVVNRFLGDGMIFDSSLTNTIRCNRIGTNAAGTAISANGGSGLFLDVSHFNLIEQNTLSGNGGAGLRTNISQHNTIQGNMVGVNSTGTAVLANTSGGLFLIGGHSNMLGGPTVAQRNVVSGNGLAGIAIASSFNNRILGNYIGVDAGATATTFGNAGAGVLLTGSTADDNLIGGTLAGESNIIANNTGDGVSFASTAGTGNRVSMNTIHSNGGLAIDLADNGITNNDLDDPDTGANNLQNFPLISSAETFFGGFRITGSLNSTANNAYRIEVYSNSTCDPSGNGEGQTFQESFEVTTGIGGDIAFTKTLTSASIPVGHFVSATATRLAAPFDTSEFSPCRAATALSIPTFTVTNTNDSGAGSLRQVITDANLTGVPELVTFNIGGAGVKTITPATPLPQITSPVIIDALTQPGATCSNPLIEINGINAGAGANGLHVSSAGDIRGLVINRFNGNGMLFDTVGNNTVRCSRIGTDPTGMTALGNGRNGLYFNEVSNNTIGGANNEGNLISANSTVTLANGGEIFDGGIRMFRSGDNVIQGNIIGPRIDGSSFNLTQRTCIYLAGGTNSQIGGTTAAERNVVNSCDRGISLSNSHANMVQGNYVGLSLNGETAPGLTIKIRGIEIISSRDNLIGGPTAGSGNVISNTAFEFDSAGIFVNGALSENTVIQGNRIGTNAAGTVAVPNKRGIYIFASAKALIGGTTPGERNIISGNTEAGIQMVNLEGQAFPISQITGNYIGLNAAGTAVIPNGFGIEISGTAPNNTISGNVISGNTTAGIKLSAPDNAINSNLIGTDPTGTLDRGNGTGILLGPEATGTLIGGANNTLRNIISGNDLGIATATGATTANGNQIQNNFIGTAMNGTSPLPNSQDGIRLESGNNSIISNVIAFNSQKGVNIFATGTGNLISRNSIHTSGTTSAHIGIDLGNNGVTLNDNGDGDLANNQQNFPVLLSATGTAFQCNLNSTPNSTFTIEFFTNPVAEPSGFGEGKTYLGSMNVTTNATGNVNFTYVPTVGVFGGEHITATATNANGDTSEFSQSRPVLGPTSANVEVAGQVLSNTGRPIMRTYLTLTDPSGNVFQSMTNPFGYFRFTEVPSGMTYILTIRDKSHDFTPSSILLEITNDITDLQLIGVRRDDSARPEISPTREIKPEARPDPNTLDKRRP